LKRNHIVSNSGVHS